MHLHVGWRQYIDNYCITYLDKKELELWDYTKPVNFEQVWKQQLREEERYTKPSPPTPKPKVHEHTFHPKHTFRPCPKFSLPPKTNTLRATIVPDLTSHTTEKPLGVIIKTNNHPARALIDTATTGTNLISNNFCYQHGIKSWSLPEPLTMSLAVKGSRSKLQREALATLQLGNHEIPCKFRLSNLDKWDMILGMPFLGKFNAIIDLGKRSVYLPKLGTHLAIDRASTLFPSSARIELLQEDIKLTDNFQTVLDQQSINKTPLNLTAAYVQAPVKATTFDPITEFPDVFPEKIPNELPPLREPHMRHRIKLIDPDKIINPQVIPIAEKYYSQFREHMTKNLDSGRIYPSSSSQTSAMSCVPKPANPQIARFVTDFRARNLNTIKDRYPLPHIPTILNRLAKAKYRSKIDLMDAYFQIRVEPEDEKHTAFKTPDGQMYNSRVMQQGDCNSPSTFMRIINYILQSFLGIFVFVYLDDIFIYSDTLKDHIDHIKQVCLKLREHRLYASAKKSQFFADKLEILGHYIDNQGIHADPSKIEKIMNWPTPTSRKKVERFNTTVNYLSQYYNNLASCMSPLTSLMGKTKFYWTPLEEKAFRATKQLAEQAAILKPIDINHPDPIFLFADTSLVGTGSWIGQGPTIYTARPAAFHSRKFTSQQTSYPTHDQELLAIVDACKYFQHILLGNHFTIITDNSSLNTLLSKPTKLLNNRQTRWIEILSPFDFEILNIPGSKNIIADALSRLHEKDPSPSPPNTSSSPSIISEMNDDQYPYLPDWDDLSDDEDETYQGHEFTDEEVVTAFANAVLSDDFSQYDNEAYEADEELEVEVQPGIDLDRELELWSGNNPSSFLAEITNTTVEESPSTFPSEQPETISLE